MEVSAYDRLYTGELGVNVQTVPIVIIGVVALIIAVGVRARVTVRTPHSATRKSFIIWVPLAVLVLAYVVLDAFSTDHHWFGSAAMVFPRLSGVKFSLFDVYAC